MEVEVVFVAYLPLLFHCFPSNSGESSTLVLFEGFLTYQVILLSWPSSQYVLYPSSGLSPLSEDHSHHLSDVKLYGVCSHL